MLKSRPVQFLLAQLLGLYLALALRSTRWTLAGAANAAPAFAGEPMIVAFWHERLPLMPAFWQQAQRNGVPMRLHVLVSRHRDGRLIGSLMRRFGLSLVHGSSSRGGPGALRALATKLQAGDHVVITPDGPRGPCRIAAPGVAQLAALAGARVLPVAAQTRRRVTLKSWDHMVVPLPFSRGIIQCQPPIAVPRTDWQSALPTIEAALTAAAAAADLRCAAA